MIADISGYTEFMLSDEMKLEHSQHIITQLISMIIGQIKIPLKISKLEGNAIFLYAVKKSEDSTWEWVKKNSW